MERKVKVYVGTEIDQDKISKIKTIASSRYVEEIYNCYFGDIDNIEQLAYYHGVDINDEILVLGKDWFIMYAVSKDKVVFLEWVASNCKEEKMFQTTEMLSAFKGVLLKNKKRMFESCLRHDSSYPFYSRMVQNGYFEEEYNYLAIDNCISPKEVKEIGEYYDCLKFVVESKESQKHPEYLKYIFHDVSFSLTDKFTSKYGKRKIKKTKVNRLSNDEV